MDVPIGKDQIVALVGSFAGGFIMTWFRGYNWFNDGITYIVSLAGGVVVAWMLGAATPIQWGAGIMMYTLMIFGAVHVGGGAAKVRAATNLPAAVLPQFNELSK